MQPSTPTDHACAIRMGKLLLRSLEMDELLSSSVDELKHVTTVNAEIFVYAHENPALEAILQHSLNTIDGRLVHLLSSLLYPGMGLRKISGSDFIYNLADHAAAHGERVFLLGAEEAANSGTVKALKQRCPNLVIEGFSPPFSKNIADLAWNQDILERIARFAPTHLVVCFGPTKQELWIRQNAERLFPLGVRCAYGLGGTADFVSGVKQRAPRWMQKGGVEWLFRAFKEKGRLWRTAKMFKMPYFAFRYYKRESQVIEPRTAITAQVSST